MILFRANALSRDDVLSGATNLGTLPSPRSLSGTVGDRDRVDHFRLRLTSRSRLNVALEGLTADADLLLLDNRGRQIAQSRRAGTLSEGLRQTLTPGVYFLQVAQVRGNANYGMQVAATSLVNPNQNLWGTYEGFATARVEVSNIFGEFVGESITRIKTTLTLAAPKRINGVQEANPFSLTIAPLSEDSTKDGAMELYSAIPYNIDAGFLAQYWRLQLTGKSLTGTLINPFTSEGLSANLLNSRREVSVGLWRSWVYDIGRGTRLFGTVSRDAIRLRITGNTTDASRPFTIEVVVERKNEQ